MLVIVATWLLGVPVLIVVLILVVDVGNWFVHKRHLQMQADAGALAGGGVFTFPCSRRPDRHREPPYAGDPSNARALQPPGRPDRSVERPRARQLGFVLERGRHRLQRRRASVLGEVRRPEDHRGEPALVLRPSTSCRPSTRTPASRSRRCCGARRAPGRGPRHRPEGRPRILHRRGDRGSARFHASHEDGIRLQRRARDLGQRDGARFGPGQLVAQIGVRVALGGGSSTTCGEQSRRVLRPRLLERNRVRPRLFDARAPGRRRTRRSPATSRLFCG